MNQKTAKLIRKYITQSTTLTGENLRKAIKTAKNSYKKTPKNKKFVIKQEMLQYV